MLVEDGFSFFFFFFNLKIHPVTIAKFERLLENKLLKWNELPTWILFKMVDVSQLIKGYLDDFFVVIVNIERKKINVWVTNSIKKNAYKFK